MKLMCVVIVLLALASTRPAFGDDLFSGGATWRKVFGDVTYTDAAILVAKGEPIGSASHAEAHRLAILGTDFEYSADVTVNDRAEAHLQFRISDEGRYGVLVGRQRFAIYRFQRIPYLAMRPPRDCAPHQPGAITHCPQWSKDASAHQTRIDASQSQVRFV
jgi:hypothetical protein